MALPMDGKSLLKFVSRHLIGLCGSYHQLNENGEIDGAKRFYTYSGFVVSLNGKWCIATAGHVIDDLQEKSQSPRIKMISQVIVDYLGNKALIFEPTPFYPLQQGKILANDDESGIDGALIELGHFFQASLEANGIEPFYPQQWEGASGQAFDAYFVLGLPDEYAEKFLDSGDAGGLVPVMMPVRPVPYDENTTFKRFKADILDMGSQRSVEGMSGGPIIGFFLEGEQTKYRLIAIQSSAAGRSTTYGCPMETFIALVRRHYELKTQAAKSAD
jgi:hypothetical protein